MHITLIDDEKVLTNNIAKKLEKQGYTTSIFSSYQEFDRQKENMYIPSLYIIDITLGDGSGYDIVAYIKTMQNPNIPILIISGNSEMNVKLNGFNIGIDDYLEKPFFPEELLARVKALLNRSHTIINHEELKYKDYIFHPLKREVSVNNQIISLTKKEIGVLEILFKNIGKVVQKEDILESVWGTRGVYEVNDNTFHCTISKIKKKLGPNFHLENRHNIGYILK